MMLDSRFIAIRKKNSKDDNTESLVQNGIIRDLSMQYSHHKDKAELIFSLIGWTHDFDIWYP